MATLTEVQIACPACDAPLTIPVTAQITGRSDDGVVQVDVTPDKAEMCLHALVCSDLSD